MAQEVTIISRQDWGAVASKDKESLKGAAQRVIIHHTDTQTSLSVPEGSRQVFNIQSYHMTQRGFDDIGYNFIIGGDGSVFEGRGWDLMGAHSKGNNRDSLGVAFLGNFNNDSPSEQAISSAKQLLQFGVSKGHIIPGFALLGHRDVGQTMCPGNNLYAALGQLKA